MNILSICSEPNTMKIIRIVVLLINIIKIVVPIVLIVFLAIKIMGAVASQNQEEITKRVKSSIPNIIAAVLIFLVPTFVDIIARLSFPNSDYAKCISGISKEKIEEAYINKMNDLISKAEDSGKYSDYANAKLYLSNIKDQAKREEYEKKLEELDEINNYGNIDDDIICNNKNNYAKVNYSNFKWTSYGKNSGPIKNYVSDNVSSYGIFAPDNIDDLMGESLPLIVWYHGSEEFVGKSNQNNYLKTGLPKVVSEWSSTGLEPIPAIIVAPHGDAGWWSGHEINDNTVEGLVKYATDYYKIDTKKIVFWGHSSGGFGAIEMAWDLKNKVTVSNIITMSSQQTSYKSNDGGKEFYSKIQIKGYGEIKKQQELFNWIGQPNNFTYYSGESHGNVPRRVLLEDLNNDKVSDVIYWLFGKNEKCDNPTSNPHGDNPSAGITANCIGDYENTTGHARLSVGVSKGNATNYKFINGDGIVQNSSSNYYYSDNLLEILINPKVTITSSNGKSTTVSCTVSHSPYPAYNSKGYYFKIKSSQDSKSQVNSPYTSNRMPYYLHIPENVGPNESLPLIVGLHGGFGIGTCNASSGRTSVITEAGQTNEYFKNVYYVGKHFQINGGKDNDLKAVILTVSNTLCSWSADMYSVVEIMRAIIKTYNIDVNRVYLTGVSQGGVGSLYLDFLEESILYKVENDTTNISDIARKYNTTVDEIKKYNKDSGHSIPYSNSSQGTLKNNSIIIVKPREQGNTRGIFTLVMPFSPAHDSYRFGFVNPEGTRPPNTLKTPIWIITSNDEYEKVQEMAKEMTRYYSKNGDIRYTVLTEINKNPSPDGNYYNAHDTDTCFFNRTSAAKWLINQYYGKVKVSSNSEIDSIEREMGAHYKQTWRP